MSDVDFSQILEDLRKVAPIFVVDALEAIAKAAGLPSAATAVIVIRSVLSYLSQHVSGKVTEEECRRGIETLVSNLQSNDDKIDKLVEEKFK